jgi:selenocysteine-specific elongation factor
VVTLPGLGRASDTIDVILRRSERAAGAPALKEATRVRMHHGSGHFPAAVYFHGTPALLPGGSTLAQFRFDAPVFAFAGDRFIVRDWAEQQTLAGGTVLDPDATRRGFRSEDRHRFLQARADHLESCLAFVASELSRDGAACMATLLIQSRFSSAEVTDAVGRLQKERKIVVQADMVADASWWQRLCRGAMEAIEATHKVHPEQSGMRLVDLQKSLHKQMSRLDVFDLLVEELCRNGCTRAGTLVRRASHRPALPSHLQPAGARLRSLLTAKPLEPPSRKELAPDSVSQQALRFLLQTGEAVEIGDELVLHADPYQRAIETIRGHIQNQGSASVSELRQVLNTSRRIMVPLLEKLDREGITLRQGDKRVLRPPR